MQRIKNFWQRLKDELFNPSHSDLFKAALVAVGVLVGILLGNDTITQLLNEPMTIEAAKNHF